MAHSAPPTLQGSQGSQNPLPSQEGRVERGPACLKRNSASSCANDALRRRPSASTHPAPPPPWRHRSKPLPQTFPPLPPRLATRTVRLKTYARTCTLARARRNVSITCVLCFGQPGIEFSHLLPESSVRRQIWAAALALAYPPALNEPPLLRAIVCPTGRGALLLQPPSPQHCFDPDPPPL